MPGGQARGTGLPRPGRERVVLVANGAVKWFNRASGFGLIEPDGGGDDLFVHRASLDESVLATAGERVEFEWREGGMGREAINVVGAAPNGKP